LTAWLTRSGFKRVDYLCHTGRASFSDQMILRVKVLVKAAMGKSGYRHDIRKSCRLNSFIPELTSGGVDDPPTGLYSFKPRLPHACNTPWLTSYLDYIQHPT
jgi:hypothetical protein